MIGQRVRETHTEVKNFKTRKEMKPGVGWGINTYKERPIRVLSRTGTAEARESLRELEGEKERHPEQVRACAKEGSQQEEGYESGSPHRVETPGAQPVKDMSAKISGVETLMGPGASRCDGTQEEWSQRGEKTGIGGSSDVRGRNEEERDQSPRR